MSNFVQATEYDVYVYANFECLDAASERASQVTLDHFIPICFLSLIYTSRMQ
jgi:hypothetical protein